MELILRINSVFFKFKTILFNYISLTITKNIFLKSFNYNQR
jgi:hypothetical protein